MKIRSGLKATVMQIRHEKEWDVIVVNVELQKNVWELRELRVAPGDASELGHYKGRSVTVTLDKDGSASINGVAAMCTGRR